MSSFKIDANLLCRFPKKLNITERDIKESFDVIAMYNFVAQKDMPTKAQQILFFADLDPDISTNCWYI
jgi:hypothetical protein